MKKEMEEESNGKSREGEGEMKLEDLVCSQEPSLRLKELGVKQESLWWWEVMPDGNGILLSEIDCLKQKINVESAKQATDKYNQVYGNQTIFCSAFTVAELGELLPEEIMYQSSSNHLKLYEYRLSGSWGVDYGDRIDATVYRFFDKKHADARAKMLIYLIEKGLIKINV